MSKVYVQSSVVCARVRISKGEVVEKGMVQRLPNGFNGNDFPGAISWSTSDQSEWAMGSGATMFYKKSKDANCELKRYLNEDRYEVLALRDIAQDEELSQ